MIERAESTTNSFLRAGIGAGKFRDELADSTSLAWTGNVAWMEAVSGKAGRGLRFLRGRRVRRKVWPLPAKSFFSEQD